MSSVGESVARLRLARLSMMRFTHSICTAVSGDSCGSVNSTIVSGYAMQAGGGSPRNMQHIESSSNHCC